MFPFYWGLVLGSSLQNKEPTEQEKKQAKKEALAEKKKQEEFKKYWNSLTPKEQYDHEMIEFIEVLIVCVPALLILGAMFYFLIINV